MLPASNVGAQLAESPVAINISDALSTTDSAQKRIIEILSECNQKIANLNLMDQLMEVHKGIASKDDVMAQQKQEPESDKKDQKKKEPMKLCDQKYQNYK